MERRRAVNFVVNINLLESMRTESTFSFCQFAKDMGE